MELREKKDGGTREEEMDEREGGRSMKSRDKQGGEEKGRKEK